MKRASPTKMHSQKCFLNSRKNIKWVFELFDKQIIKIPLEITKLIQVVCEHVSMFAFSKREDVLKCMNCRFLTPLMSSNFLSVIGKESKSMLTISMCSE